MSSERLAEPVVWGGPIVMNTKEELNKAFDDLRRGTFLQAGYRTDKSHHAKPLDDRIPPSHRRFFDNAYPLDGQSQSWKSPGRNEACLGTVEAVFDIIYLAAALMIGMALLITARGNTVRTLAGVMALILAAAMRFICCRALPSSEGQGGRDCGRRSEPGNRWLPSP
jgi:hypothetical protein